MSYTGLVTHSSTGTLGVSLTRYKETFLRGTPRLQETPFREEGQVSICGRKTSYSLGFKQTNKQSESPLKVKH